jgi:hypothetical protein
MRRLRCVSLRDGVEKLQRLLVESKRKKQRRSVFTLVMVARARERKQMFFHNGGARVGA